MILKHGFQIVKENTFHKRTVRWVTNETKIWERRYKRNTRIKLEEYWKKKLSDQWENQPITSVANDDKPKFYCLSMFPYPSGRLHMGHVRVYTISDTFAQFYRMNGYNVIHPMGWDAFGLPAENAARDRQLDPEDWTKCNISYMKNQLKDLNLTFDWDREFSTCDPEYYKWTQYIFVKLFEAGLAYQKEAVVNWDPVDQTVLADEQVDEQGRSWRSGAMVEQKYLKQWFFKTTDYAKSLLGTLNQIEEDVGIKAMQRHWIGNIDGYYFDFLLENEKMNEPFHLPVFCTHPEGVFGASHIVLQTTYKDELAHQLRRHGADNLKSQLLNSDNNSETLLNASVKNPFSGQHLPIIISSEFIDTYRRPTAVLSIPNVNDRARNMAERYKFDFEDIIDERGLVKNSKQFDGLELEDARVKILSEAKKLGVSGCKATSSRLSDWLISRQRYWGTPIPIIHCPTHGPVLVPIEELPVRLPKVDKIATNSGMSPLQSVESWVRTSCPKCGVPSKRETDTMDTFVDSSWYFLRYADPHNSQHPFEKDITDKTMPVDLYIGGKEHATLHLYYARFLSHFLADQNMHSRKEPFKKILAQGIIKGLTHQVESTGKYILSDDVDKTGPFPVTKDTNERVEESFQKMSKSKLNGIDPEDFVSEWGISITRLYVLYAAAPFEDIHWDVKTDVIPGVMRWQLKLWNCVTKLSDARNRVSENDVKSKKLPMDLSQDIENLAHNINRAILDVTNHYTKDCVLSAAITSLMTLAKTLSHASSKVVTYSPEFERGLCALVIMSAPMVPHFSSELWSGLRLMPYKLTVQDWGSDVLYQRWPQPKIIEHVKLTEYKVRVNRQVCHSVRLPSDIDDLTEVESTILTHRKVKRLLKGAVPSDLSLDKVKLLINISVK